MLILLVLEHGNILLSSDNLYPVLKGGFSVYSSAIGSNNASYYTENQSIIINIKDRSGNNKTLI